METSLGRVRNLSGDVVEGIVAEQDTGVIAVRRDPVVHRAIVPTAGGRAK